MIFSANVLKRWSFQKKLHWNMIFLVLPGKMIFRFPENMLLFFRRKMKDHLSRKIKKIHRNMIFSVYSVKMVFLFPINMILPFCQKNKDDLLPKNILTDDISGIIEKNDIHPIKHGISPNRNNKDDKKAYSVKYA